MIRLSITKGSIKNKVIFLVTSQLLVALISVLAVVLMLVNEQVGQQTEKLFVSNASSLNSSIEQRLSYLAENSKLLATNELMVNALTDEAGRDAYLPPLVSNFVKGKNVLNLNVVDFDGTPIFQMGEDLPSYNQYGDLRTALTLNRYVLFIDKAHHLVLINPIEYYSTTQGAIIIRFDLERIITPNLDSESSLYTRLIKDNTVIYSDGYDASLEYTSYSQPNLNFPYFQQLGLTLEVGLPVNEYNASTRKAISILGGIGGFLLLLSLLTSRWIALKITAPILELSSRVKRAHAGEDIQCSPLGSGDELDNLAEAFDERTMLLEYQAEHDDLTQLPNKLLFIEHLKHEIKAAHRSGEHFAVLFLDLDRFKEINDSYGHNVGDQLLQVVADKIAENVRESDSVARMGGDEFTILVNGLHHDVDLSIIVQNILSTFSKPITFTHHQFYLTCSIGVAIYPEDGTTPDELLKNADAAMYKAKAEGRNTYRFYQQELTATIVERIQLQNDLRQAIDRDEFRVFYQPQCALPNGELIGVEALLRWQHPKKGLLAPFNFIPLAEETGMIVEIDRLMILSAMNELSQWKKANLSPGILSMNLSMVQLAQNDFVDFVKRSLSACDLSAQEIMFEVTETQAMLNPESTITMLNQLHELGIGLAIDDFGTGFSSLAYLKRFPVQKIKIDRSFISDIPEDKDDETLTKAIISLSQSLNLSVIAEGVETQAQVDFLNTFGCSEGQGYLFSKPIPGEELRELCLENQQSLVQV